jgi:lipid-A-disaccharide synthase
MGVPIVAMYRLAGILDNIVQKLVLPIGKYNYFSLPNVLLGRKVVPELGNRDVNAEQITKEALRLLRDTDARQTVLDSLAEVRPLLGDAGAVQRAADIAEKLMSGTSTRRSADRQAA